MFNSTCNATLDDLRIGKSEIAFAGSLTFHQLCLLIEATCVAISVLLSLYLIWMHAFHYTKPNEQRYIMRVLFMVPVYSTSTFLLNWFYWHSVYFQLVSATYAAIAVASYFTLVCNFVAGCVHDYKAFFRGVTPKPWGNFFPIPIGWFRACCGGERGIWRTPRSGLTLFNILCCGVFQYSFFRIAMSIVAAITQYFGRYCQGSVTPSFAHIWILAVNVCSATAAMYCLDQFSWQMKDQLMVHKTKFKLICIKLVFAFSLYQTLVLSIITSEWIPKALAVNPTEKLALPDLKIGIPTLMLCIELLIMSILHIFAFPWEPYRISSGSMDDTNSPVVTKQGGFLGILALIDACNIWDLVKALGRAVRWLFVGFLHRKMEASYNLMSKTTAHETTMFRITANNHRTSESYFELSESNGEFRSPYDDVHPRAIDTLL